MRLQFAFVVLPGICLFLSGCHRTVIESNGSDGHAKISLNNGGVAIHSDSKDGESADIKVNGAQVNLGSKDSSFSLDAGKDGFKMKAQDKNSKFENSATITEAELGVPFYPGSEEVNVACMRAEDEKSKNVIEVRTSKDSPDKVIAYYKPLLNDPEIQTSQEGSETKYELKGKDKAGNEIAVSAAKDAGKSETSVTVVHSVKK